MSPRRSAPTAGTLPVPEGLPRAIGLRGVRHNTLLELDLDVPLWRMVAVVGVSGSGKSSLAMGTLYAEGMHRFLEGLSTYSRRRLEQAKRPDLDAAEHLPATLALRQRPPIPGPRSTVGTMSEVLNVLRLMMSRLGSHRCPNGHMVPPSIATQQMEITCPTCGVGFAAPSAESFASNSYGACPACDGLGRRSEIDPDTLIGDPEKTIEEGAVLPWNSGGRRLPRYAAAQLGVRLDVPWRELSAQERRIVMQGKPVRKQVVLRPGSDREVTLNVLYDNAVTAAERSARSESERSRHQAGKFLSSRVCSVCHGTRLRPEALTSQLDGRDIAQLSALDPDTLHDWSQTIANDLPDELSRLTTGLLRELAAVLDPLLALGLGYLTLDRAGATLSTGERQRIELTSTVRSQATGMLYVLDEPSVGLHPSNVVGLRETLAALTANGNSLVVVEHDVELIRTADWVIELGPGAGEHGGRLIAQGTPAQVRKDPRSLIGPFLAGELAVTRRREQPADAPQIAITITDLYNLHDVTATFATSSITALAGPSGAGKTAIVLDSLVPALRAQLAEQALPGHVGALQPAAIRDVVAIDAAPIGQNTRSIPATYSGAMDVLRSLFAQTPTARRRRWRPGHFSFNTREGQCPTCRGLGEIDLDVQYLPDIEVICPTCHGARFNEQTLTITIDGLTIADVLALTVEEALARFADETAVVRALAPIAEVGLGYLRLGEPTPALSGGEAQRLKIAARLRSSQRDVLYVFDEPSTGLHPLDIRTLVAVFDRLLHDGATVVVIDHDLDILAAADRIIDVGPGGGPQGGRIVAQGTPAQLAADPDSVTGPYLAAHLG
jgi:excinuclease ABC subunit A